MSSQHLKKKKHLIFFIIFILAFFKTVYAKDLQILHTRYVKVLFEASLESAAKQVAGLCPEVKEDLESIFGWKLDLTPTVILKKNREHFLRMSGDPLVVAFAVPSRNLIVIDYSRMITRPFSLETTLKHELCHLLLHSHIKDEILPQWLDEGLCQWVSGGIGEIMMDPKRSRLNRAAFSKKFIPFQDLKQGFPYDENGRLLAYEESKSFVEYLARKYKNDGILNILNRMKQGQTAGDAIIAVLSIPLETLENEWQGSLKQRMSWFAYLSYHLYEILFTLMALITIIAFIRLSFRKRNYIDDEDVDD